MTLTALTVRYHEITPLGDLAWYDAILNARDRLLGNYPVLLLGEGGSPPYLLIAVYQARTHGLLASDTRLQEALEFAVGESPAITLLVSCGRVSPPLSARRVKLLAQAALSPPIWGGLVLSDRAIDPSELEEIVAQTIHSAARGSGLSPTSSGDQVGGALLMSREDTYLSPEDL